MRTYRLASFSLVALSVSHPALALDVVLVDVLGYLVAFVLAVRLNKSNKPTKGCTCVT